MDIEDIIKDYKEESNDAIGTLFTNIFILQNRLQTIFDKFDPELTLKQFMLLVMIEHSVTKTTFTSLGKMLGSSRQNIKKIATSLQKKGFVTIKLDPNNKRNTCIVLTKKAMKYMNQPQSIHAEKLHLLFSDYSEQEIQLFYSLTMKLYNGVEKVSASLLDDEKTGK